MKRAPQPRLQHLQDFSNSTKICHSLLLLLLLLLHPPAPIFRHSLSPPVSCRKGGILTFGGMSIAAEKFFNDAYYLVCGAECSWVTPEQDGVEPLARNSHSATVVRQGSSKGRMVVIGSSLLHAIPPHPPPPPQVKLGHQKHKNLQDSLS